MMKRNKILIPIVAAVALFAGLGAAVNVKGAIVNALSGFQFNGTAPLNHTLCGNGSVYVDATSCGATTSPTETSPGRSFATTYQNTGTTTRHIYGYADIAGGSGDSTIACYTATHGGGLVQKWANVTTATAPGSHVGFDCQIPPGYDYQVQRTNIISGTPAAWYELQ